MFPSRGTRRFGLTRMADPSRKNASTHRSSTPAAASHRSSGRKPAATTGLRDASTWRFGESGRVILLETSLVLGVRTMGARETIAQRIAAGLAGYFQYVHASNLLDLPGEDTAQFVM